MMLRHLASLCVCALWTHRALADAAVESSELEGLMIEVVKPPKKCDLKSMAKDFVEIHFTTKIAKSSKSGTPGKKVDTSRDEDGLNDPLSFQIDGHQVIPGWNAGVRDMCEGEVRVLTIPPEHAYGEDGYKQQNSDGDHVDIPPGATLRIESELMKIIRLQKEVTSKPKTCKKSAALGDTVKVHYTLWIHPTSISGDKGSMVESSREPQEEPMKFRLGAGQVIPGWDQGLLDTCEGESLELIVPPEFAYREKGQGDKIPPLATLHFKVEVLEVVEENMFQEMDKNSDGKIESEELASFLKKGNPGIGAEQVTEIFESEDGNKDGVIDWDEAHFPKGERPSGNKQEL